VNSLANPVSQDPAKNKALLIIITQKFDFSCLATSQETTIRDEFVD